LKLKVREQLLQILLVISRLSSFVTERALFSSWPDYQGLAILVQSQEIFSFSGAKVAKDWTMSVWSIMSFSCKEISGTVLGRFFVEVLVFVILTFFKEGIGNILTMPLGSWVLEMGLGTCGTSGR
jgi:hypothetical protein